MENFNGVNLQRGNFSPVEILIDGNFGRTAAPKVKSKKFPKINFQNLDQPNLLFNFPPVENWRGGLADLNFGNLSLEIFSISPSAPLFFQNFHRLRFPPVKSSPFEDLHHWNFPSAKKFHMWKFPTLVSFRNLKVSANKNVTSESISTDRWKFWVPKSLKIYIDRIFSGEKFPHSTIFHRWKIVECGNFSPLKILSI